jgi:hypothetical protein
VLLIVAGVLIADRWIFAPHVGPHPAVLRVGEREQTGRISIICWPGVPSDSDPSDDGDPCVSRCPFPDTQSVCPPGEALDIAVGDPLDLDFSRTGRPELLNYRVYAINEYEQPLLYDGAVPNAARTTLPPLDLPPGEYALVVRAEFALLDGGQPGHAEYDQSFRLNVLPASSGRTLLPF